MIACTVKDGHRDKGIGAKSDDLIHVRLALQGDSVNELYICHSNPDEVPSHTKEAVMDLGRD